MLFKKLPKYNNSGPSQEHEPSNEPEPSQEPSIVKRKNNKRSDKSDFTAIECNLKRVQLGTARRAALPSKIYGWQRDRDELEVSEHTMNQPSPPSKLSMG